MSSHFLEGLLIDLINWFSFWPTSIYKIHKVVPRTEKSGDPCARRTSIATVYNPITGNVDLGWCGHMTTLQRISEAKPSINFNSGIFPIILGFSAWTLPWPWARRTFISQWNRRDLKTTTKKKKNSLKDEATNTSLYVMFYTYPGYTEQKVWRTGPVACLDWITLGPSTCCNNKLLSERYQDDSRLIQSH